MVVSAVGVSLPYLDHGIRNRRAFAIENTTYQANALSLGLRLGDAAYTTSTFRQSEGKKWTNRLRGSGNHFHFIQTT